MFSEKFIKLKSYADAQLSNYFPSVRGAVLLIVIPAVFIVPIYFFSILSEIVTGKTHRPVLEYETRLAAIKKDLPAFISPFLIGSSIIVILFPTSRLRGVWLVLTISLGAGVGLGITSSMIFLWLAFIGPPDSYYFAAELTLAVMLALFAFYRIHYSGCRTQEDSGLNCEAIPGTIVWLRNIFLFLMLVSVGSFLLKTFLQDPHGIWDAVDTWNYRARWLFRGGPHWSYAFSLRAKDGLDYPLLVTASVFRMWQILGKDPIAIPILVAGIFTFGSYLILFSSLALLRGRNQGYLAAICLFVSTLFFCICYLSRESERSLECFAAEDYNSALANMGLSFLLLRQGAGKKCCNPGCPHPFLQG